MKKLLNLFLLSILTLSCTSLIGQETEKVFMIDLNINLTKNFSADLVPAVRIFPSSNSQSGFAVPEYSIKNNDIIVAKVDNGKRIPLEINPRKVPLFFSINNSNGNRNVLMYDFSKPGEFMNREGEIVFPDKVVNAGLRGAIEKKLVVAPPPPNKAVTDKNTVFNSKLENPANKNNSDKIFERVSVQNTNFNILCNIISSKNGAKETITFYGFSLGKKGQFQGPFNGAEFMVNGDFDGQLFQVQDRTNTALGRGEAITTAQCLANNLIGILNQCKSGSKPGFCSIVDQDDLNEQLKSAILNACNLKNPDNPAFSSQMFSKDNPFFK